MKKLVRSSLSEDAYTFLRELFLSATRYNPGDKISVEELSRKLGVSRTPLWGAINRLEAEGIVEVVPRLGVYLINYDPGRVLDIYLAREGIEGVVARLAAQRITVKASAALRANVIKQQDFLKKNQVENYYVAALEFHEIIASAANSPTLSRLLASIFAQMRAMRVQRKSALMNLPQSCHDHREILKAIEKRDPDLAEERVRRHIRDLSLQVQQELVPAIVPRRAAKANSSSTSRL